MDRCGVRKEEWGYNTRLGSGDAGIGDEVRGRA